MLLRLYKYRSFVASIALCVVAPIVHSQAWPAKPIHLIVPYAAGGGTDVTVRALSEPLAAYLGQPIIVENRPGASTMIATSHVIKANPDGYTVLVTDIAHSANPALFRNVPYKIMEDLESVAFLTLYPAILVVRPSLNVQTVADLVALARKEPGKLNYSSAGHGSLNHLGSELFKKATGIDVVQITYKGAAPAVTALLGGHVDFAMLPYTLANPYLQSGKLKALAVTLDARLALLPDVPTFLESGIKDVIVTTGFGVRVPKNTPPEVISKLNNAFNAALQDSKVQVTLRSSGIIAVGGPPSRLDAYLNEETVRWLKTIPPQARID